MKGNPGLHFSCSNVEQALSLSKENILLYVIPTIEKFLSIERILHNLKTKVNPDKILHGHFVITFIDTGPMSHNNLV